MTAPSAPTASRYRFLHRFASGGMAELYLGEATGVGGVKKRVALKRMLPAFANDASFVEMFLSEARLASTLQHPNIVQTYDVLQSEGEYIIVMEYLEGLDLQQVKRRARQAGVAVSLQHALHVGLSALAGLHYAHERVGPDGPLGIVHRDVSPHNLFLTYDGGVKLLDFGIAVKEGQQAASEGSVVKGKVLYMAPEQCLAQKVDRRADVYGVGAVLYELLTGKVPFRGRNVYETMRAIVEAPLVQPRHLAPDLDPDLEQILLQALAKPRDERFATAREMHRALEAYAASLGVFLSPVATAELVEAVAPREVPPSASEVELPPDIEAEGDAPAVPVSEPVAAAGPIHVDDRAVLRRVGGVLVLSLKGILDEGFDPKPYAGKIYGDLLVDTSGVERVTSFGIRSLLGLWAEVRPNLRSFTHARCSVSFLSQVVMIRSVLGGGRVYSFQLPYVDPLTGDAFTVTLAGDAAREAVASRRAPPAAPPWDPQGRGEVDDDESVLLALDGDLAEEPPAQVLAALRILEGEEQRLDVELEVIEGWTRLTLRRPVRGGRFRWSRVVQPLEGDVEIDFSEVPSVDDPGCVALAEALLDVEGLVGLRLVGAPAALCRALRDAPERRERPVRWASLRVVSRCVRCRAEQVAVLEMVGGRLPPCRRCGGALQVTEPVADLLPAVLAAGTPSVPAATAKVAPPSKGSPVQELWASVLRWFRGKGS